MAKKEIRAKYIKNLIADKEALSKTLEESTKESLSSLLDEGINKQLRKILAESEDSFTEEEVDPKENEFDAEPEEDDAKGSTDLEGSETEDGIENVDGETEGNEVWDEVSDTQDAEGEYDLRGKGIDTVLKVLQQMDDNDDIRIIKNGDNTATIEQGEGDDIVIDIDGGEDSAEPNEFEDDINVEPEIDSDTEDDDMVDDIDISDLEGEDDVDDDETSFEVEIDDNEDNNEEDDNGDMLNEGNVNLGYTDNYQNKTAMTMPSDKGEGEGDSRFDNGAPKGGENNKKRWVGSKGKNGGNPYTQKTKQPMSECDANECGNIFEIEIEDGEDMVDEAATTVSGRGNAHRRGVTRSTLTNRSEDQKKGTRNGHEDGVEKGGRGTGDGYAMNESKKLSAMTRKVNAVLNENKELRDIMKQVTEKLNEAVVINSSLAKVIRLVTENSTTRDEKINILNRFNKVQNLNECKNLYNQISSELNGSTHRNSNNLLNNQLTEAKSKNNNMIVETNMLNSSRDLQEILDLQERMLKLGK